MNDKTRNKLMESMRMTKDPAKKAEDTKASVKPAEKPAPAKKPVAKKKPEAKKAAQTTDAYQSSSQRVWPD